MNLLLPLYISYRVQFTFTTKFYKEKAGLYCSPPYARPKIPPSSLIDKSRTLPSC